MARFSFCFSADYPALRAFVTALQREVSSGEVPLQKSFVQTQLLPRKLTATGRLFIRMGLKGLAAAGKGLWRTSPLCPNESYISVPKRFSCA